MRFLPFVIFIPIVVLTIAACSESSDIVSLQDATQTEVPKKVWTTLLVPAAQGTKRHLTGTIQAADAVAISFEVTGVIAKMQVNLGQSFQKGDVLAELNPAVYLLAVQQSQSSLAESEASLVDAKQTYDRNETLRQQGLVSQAVLDSAAANFDIAKQRVNVARSSLNLAKENLSDTKLIAPYSGRVSERLVEPSQQVSPGTSIFRIQGNANLEVNAAIPEGLISKVTLLDHVQVVVPSLSTSRTFPATLTEIGAQASVANAFPITITFNDPHDGFYPGMSAEIILSVSTQFASDEYFEIPFSAFTNDQTGPYLYLIEQSKKDTPFIVKKRYIDIVELKSETVIITFKQSTVLDDYSSARIVKTGLDFLRPEQSVSVVESSTQIYNQ